MGSDWETKYSRAAQLETEPNTSALLGFNWKAVKILSSSTLSAQNSNLVQLVLKIETTDGTIEHETLELTAPELNNFIVSLEKVASAI